jgi:hypothetical protein
MAIVVGLDVQRAQITYDALDTATGEVATGRITPADRTTLRAFLRRWSGEEMCGGVGHLEASAQRARPTAVRARGDHELTAPFQLGDLLGDDRLPRRGCRPPGRSRGCAPPDAGLRSHGHDGGPPPCGRLSGQR